MSDERYERGLKHFKEITGEVGEKFIQNLEEISKDFSRYLIEFPYGDIYNRPGLDFRTRELVTLSSLAALGYAEPELKAHIKVALSTGVTREEVLEVFIQTSVYAGFPAAINALLAAKEVFNELDQKKE
ncbi:carboxymuconolactone decarboxylase family protein [Desulfobacterota bacterium AH_259_B03_O07]|nr:carboxymuconolactone decarboxylase family protein [Desulfobacterota bacterium AH_259_B03_O07]